MEPPIPTFPDAQQAESRQRRLRMGDGDLFWGGELDLRAQACACRGEWLGWTEMSTHPVYAAAQTVAEVFLNKNADHTVISLRLGNKRVCHNAKQTSAQGLGFLSLKLSAQQKC